MGVLSILFRFTHIWLEAFYLPLWPQNRPKTPSTAHPTSNQVDPLLSVVLHSPCCAAPLRLKEISLAYRRQCLRGHPSRGGSARNYLKLQAEALGAGGGEL